MYIIISFIISLLIICYSHIRNFYNLKTVKLQRKNISKRNKNFIQSRLTNILDYFDSTEVNVIVNYQRNEIVGFFICVNKNTEVYGSLKSGNVPTISHELSIDEFCSFISTYLREENDKCNVITELMREHLQRLK